jgi:hypothetical protein
MIPFGEMAAPVMNRFVVFTGHSYILHEPGKTGTKQDKQNHAICLKSPYPSTLSKWVQRASYRVELTEILVQIRVVNHINDFIVCLFGE